ARHNVSWLLPSFSFRQPEGEPSFSSEGSSHKLPDDSLIYPEHYGCSDADGREEGVGASVVAGGDTSPVLEPGEEGFDFVAVAVEVLVIVIWGFAASARWDAWLDASGFEFGAEPGAVVAAIGDEMRGRGEASSM